MRSIILTTVLLAACGRGSGSNTDSGLTADIFAGTWKSVCLTTGTASSTQVVVTYTDDTETVDSTSYSDISCTGVSMIYHVAGAVAVNGAADQLGVYKVTRTTKIDTLVAKTTEAANNASTLVLYGSNSWAVDLPKDISGLRRAPNETAEPAAGTVIYDIIKVDGKQIYTGDLATGDGKTDATRPTKLDTTVVLTKQ